MSKKWVDPDDAPRLTRDDIRRPDAQWRIGGKPVSAEEGKAAFRAAFRAAKRRVNIHFDEDVIEFFQKKSGGHGYQTLINAALREYMEGARSGRAERDEPVQRPADVVSEIRQQLNEIMQVMRKMAITQSTSRMQVLVFAGDPKQAKFGMPGLRPSATRSNNDLTLHELH